METLEYRHNDIDKTQWGQGPWIDEPDKVQWEDDATRYPCIIKRNHYSGFWCGYVGVTKGHPAFEADYDDLAVDVHGGLTFGGFCAPHEDTYDGEAHAICHVVQSGEDDRVFWHGFDCGHYMDRSPANEAVFKSIGQEKLTYRTMEYAKQQCRYLASQLAALGT